MKFGSTSVKAVLFKCECCGTVTHTAYASNNEDTRLCGKCYQLLLKCYEGMDPFYIVKNVRTEELIQRVRVIIKLDKI